MLWFAYQNAKGAKTRRALTAVKESTDYIRGTQIVDGAIRTFRKAQVIEYFDSERAFNACTLPDPEPTTEGNYTPKTRSPSGPEICFTGFNASVREALEAQATQAGLWVRKSVTSKLSFLCTGPNAGPKKVDAALRMGVVIMDQEAFGWMLETGEIPV